MDPRRKADERRPRESAIVVIIPAESIGDPGTERSRPDIPNEHHEANSLQATKSLHLDKNYTLYSLILQIYTVVEGR